MKIYLGLSNAGVFPGSSLTFDDETAGEVVLYSSRKFRYQILTDPVNYGRIVVSDSENVENRWPMFSEIESYIPHLRGLVLLGDFSNSDLQTRYYNLKSYLANNMVTCFKPDMPELLKETLNRTGPVKGILTPQYETAEDIGNNGNFNNNFYSNTNLTNDKLDPVKSLSTSLEFFWDIPGQRKQSDEKIQKKYVVVAYDFGLSYSILRNLTRYGCDIRIVPADCPPEELIALKPEGILLAGGPGNPQKMEYAIKNIARLIGIRPILATGLGFILLGLSMGVDLEPLVIPHFGNEIEVVKANNGQLSENASFKTDQTHFVSLNQESLEKTGFRVTLVNAGDNSVEGYENEEFLIQAYAFSLGDKDAFKLSCIRKFIDCMDIHRAGKKLFQ